jgi:hypothetical protein
MSKDLKKEYHYIYKTICDVTDKYYIGMHSTSKLDDSYIGSGKYLRHSIDKYGIENHTKYILEFLNDRKSLEKREAEIVNEDLLKDPMCMNLTIGGGGGFSIEQQRKNAIASNAKQKILKENNPEWWLNRSKKISEGNKIAYDIGLRKRGPFFNWTGKKHTDETKRKIGEKNAKKQKGEHNSQFGTRWITNEIENKKISRYEEPPIGWRFGRKLK